MTDEVLAILSDIHARVLRIETRLDTLAAQIALPPRAQTALLPRRGQTHLRADRLLPYASEIAAWVEQGKLQREIAALLTDRGVRVDRTAVSRFIRGRLMPDATEYRP